MLGLEDKWIAAAYLLSIASAVLCVIYSLLTRNQGNDSIEPSDVKWVNEEKNIDQQL